MGFSKTVHADKDGILANLNEQRGWADEGGQNNKLQRDRIRARGRAEGLRYAIRLIEAWQLPGPDTLAQAMAGLQDKLDGGTPGPEAWVTFARQIWADMGEILGDPVPGEDLGTHQAGDPDEGLHTPLPGATGWEPAPLPQVPMEHLRRVSPEGADWAQNQAGDPYKMHLEHNQAAIDAGEWHGISRVVGHTAADCPGPVMCDYAKEGSS